ncbi:hypothetical protein [Methylocapsa sp. S129]|uniref:hypothetical protein n=1 Tax=Methylocapsa sp. S129 TaxID=1641869 RepID=UPI00131E4864|nr:hypothetical protein [Methylocapsa sp. S129]
MPRLALLDSLLTLASVALVGDPQAAHATVIIKSFQFKICITGAKHPDGCKNVDADARVVVSDDAMERFDSEIGLGASIEAVPDRNAAPLSSVTKSHRHQQPGG